MDTHAELAAFAGSEPAVPAVDLQDGVKRVFVPGCLVKHLEARRITTHTPIAPVTEAFVAGCSNCHNIADFTVGANTPAYVGRCATDLAAQAPANC